MNLKECYLAFGGDYQDVCSRLPSTHLIQKMLVRFSLDPSAPQLFEALENQDREAAFRCAHTLKGICQTLGFTALLDSSRRLTEALRPGTPYDPQAVGTLTGQVERDYRRILEAAAQLDP